VVLGLGLSAGLPGCWLLPVAEEPPPQVPAPPVPVARVPVAVAAPGSVAVVASPYHPLMPVLAAAGRARKDAPVRPAHCRGAPTAAEAPAPPEPSRRVEIHFDPLPEPEVRAKPAEEPLLAALRCVLDKRPAEALEWLQRYDKPNQDLL